MRKPHPQASSKPVTDKEIASYWRASEEDDAAFERFAAAVDDLLMKQEMTPARISAILTHLGDEDPSLFLENVERIAANRYLKVRQDGAPATAAVRMFGIPIAGLTEAIDSTIDTRGDEILTALKTSGFSPEDAGVVIFPVLLPLEALAAITPADIHAVSADAASVFAGQKAPESHMEDIASVLQNLLPGREEDREQEGVGLRFLLGAELLVTPLEDDTRPEGAIFEIADGTDLDAISEAWDSALNPSREDRVYRIDYPVAWELLRSTMLGAYVAQKLAVAMADDPPSEGLRASPDAR